MIVDSAMLLKTKAEQRAEKAENLRAFSGFKLLHVKRQLNLILNLIGRDGIFDEYTKHDISHIDEMLEILEWVIPDQTKDLMSSTDWLLIVLSIYFHDLGMLVTKEEYTNRRNSGFELFVEELLSGETGEDYGAKISMLADESRQRFLYQEFVRSKHAERVKAWILGKAPQHLGQTHQTMREISNLLETLDITFREDLALICESHHLDDLHDFNKYFISKPYGNSPAETANVHYAALLLRTVDLLHITSDRTPSIVFKLINPQDPVSQKEWAKQLAVKAVRPQKGLNKDGVPDKEAPKDTIEIFATFKEQNGFFGLTSYLSYAQDQIQKNYEWCQVAINIQGSDFLFPWKFIDDTNIDTKGFIKKGFEFSLDQRKVLDLLTGHTLYNDTNVVLRELVQNAIDAVRFKKHIDPSVDKGVVDITWNESDRVLCVKDNGTGMTQSIIENHLLKVGSSRYDSNDFKKNYPDFSSISRFGIGILSTFMIADRVEIITCHPEEPEIRHLTLRSVHGKYLIALIDKDSNMYRDIYPHGTMIKLTVRPSAKIKNIEVVVKKWILFPECEVYVKENEKPKRKITYASPKHVLEEMLIKLGYSLKENQIKVEQIERNGVILAFALKWSPFFKEWSFMSIRRHFVDIALGICVEGVRVEFETPGFLNQSIFAIANVKGKNAPKTNVARTKLENTIEKENMLQSIYSIYFEHIQKEIEKLQRERKFSLTWAIQEANFLMNPFVTKTHHLASRKIFEQVFKNIPLLLIEKDNKRFNVTLEDFVNKEDYFWIIDSNFVKSAEDLMKELPGNNSLSKIFNTLFENTDLTMPKEAIFCGPFKKYIMDHVMQHKEVKKIILNLTERRIDLLWGENTGLWKKTPKEWYYPNTDYTGRRKLANIQIADEDVEIIGATDEIGVKTLNTYFLFGDSPLVKYLREKLDIIDNTNNIDELNALKALFRFMFQAIDRYPKKIKKSTIEKDLYDSNDRHLEIEKFIDVDRLEFVFNSTDRKIFNSSFWVRNQ